MTFARITLEGSILKHDLNDVEVILAESSGCSKLQNAVGKILLLERGGCPFAEKALNAQNAGAVAAIIYNSMENDTAEEQRITEFTETTISLTNFEIGQTLFILSNKGVWRTCTVVTINNKSGETLLQIHYEGFPSKFDEVLQIVKDADRIRTIIIPTVSISHADGAGLAESIGEAKTTISLLNGGHHGHSVPPAYSSVSNIILNGAIATC